MKRNIPATMATQHPDNAHSPFWKEGSAFVGVHEEPEECIVCLRDMGAQEFMWDWEGKYADESVIDKLFAKHHSYLKKNLLGRDKFLTFRLPNIWKEKGYSLIRALMVVLTSEDFAHDL
ncbi:MAG: phosphoenolpyruvate carboxylase, partial [bacterium]|nr:phosphoenolpyruvate carboxylase [bacterium]